MFNEGANHRFQLVRYDCVVICLFNLSTLPDIELSERKILAVILFNPKNWVLQRYTI